MKKAFKQIFSVILTIMLVCSVPGNMVLAEETALNNEYAEIFSAQKTGDRISLSVAMGYSFKNEFLTVYVTDGEYDTPEAAIEADKLEYIKLFQLDKNGKLEAAVSLINTDASNLFVKAEKFTVKTDLSLGKVVFAGEKNYNKAINVFCELPGESSAVLSVDDAEVNMSGSGYGFSAGISKAASEESIISVTASKNAFTVPALALKYTADRFGLLTGTVPVDGDNLWEQFEARRRELPDEVAVMPVKAVRGNKEIYVAQNGNDSTGDGSIDKPYKTFEKGIEALKTAEKSGGAVLWIREGVYSLTETQKLDSLYSGREEKPVFISAYPGEDVSVIGGTVIESSKFRALTSSDAAYSRIPSSIRSSVMVFDANTAGVSLPGITAKTIPTLASDKEKLTLARYPDKGDANVVLKSVSNVTDDTFSYTVSDNEMLSWGDLTNTWVYGTFSADWDESHYSLISKSELTFTAKQRANSKVTEDTSSINSTIGHYYYNVPEALNLPGEWYIDTEDGKIYLYPQGGETKYTLSKNEPFTLMTLDGTENIVINGIEFADAKTGIAIVNGRDNQIQNCAFRRTTGEAVVLEGSYNGMIYCVVEDLESRYSVSLTDRRHESIPDEIGEKPSTDFRELVPQRNYVQNCEFYGNSTMWVCYAQSCIISHNKFDTTMCAVNLYHSIECIIEYNDFVANKYTTNDMGIIYVNGAPEGRGNHIRCNYMHRDANVGYTAWDRPLYSVYFDDMSSGNFAYENYIARGRLYIHGGSYNIFYNNAVNESININDDWLSQGRDKDWANHSSNPGTIYQYYWHHAFSDGVPNIWAKRFPYFKLNHDKFDAYKKGTVTDATWLRAPKDNIIKNNIVSGAGIRALINYDLTGTNAEGTAAILNNYENENYSGKDQSLSSLVNITDTGITPSGKAAEKLPDFETIPPLTQMGVLQKKCDSDLVITKKSITDDKVSFKVHNYSNADITGYGIIACYNNKLEKVFSTKPITMYSNSETTIFEDYNVENYSLYDEVYVFLWKESLCPITEKSRVR